MRDDNFMTQKNKLDFGFPQTIVNEYEYVISLVSKEDNGAIKAVHAYNSENEFYILSDGTKVMFPYRIYFSDNDNDYSLLNDNEKLIYDCIFTRSNDGHIREKHIRNILMRDYPEWCFPYIVRLSADYVLEIINTIYESLKVLNNSQIQAFCKNNNEIVQTNFRRMSSYWSEYYRRDYPDFSTYTGTKLFTNCLMPNTDLSNCQSDD